MYYLLCVYAALGRREPLTPEPFNDWDRANEKAEALADLGFDTEILTFETEADLFLWLTEPTEFEDWLTAS